MEFRETLKLVTFDLDDTLWAIEPAIARAEQELHHWLLAHVPRVAHRFPPIALRSLRHETEWLHPELQGDLSGLRQRSIEIALERCDVPTEHASAAFDVFWQARNQVEFFADVIPALDRLKSRYRLAAISNGNACIRRTGLDAWFDFAISASGFGAAKPARGIFLHACEKAGVEPHQVLHVGDDIHCDVNGALDAGMHAAWLDRSGATPRETLPQRAWHVRDLATLAERLAEPHIGTVC